MSTKRVVGDLADLGACLRAVRERVGMSGSQLAARVPISQSKISRIETGHLAPSMEDLEMMLDALGANESERSETAYLAKRADSRSGRYRFRPAGGSRNPQSDIIQLEATTTHYRSYDPILISGLLQTPEYMRAMISSAVRVPFVQETFDVRNAVQMRLARKSALENKNQQFEFILTPEALRRPYLGPAGMKEQWSHLVQVASHPNVSIGVLGDAVFVNLWIQQFSLYDSERLTMDLQFMSLESSQPTDVKLCEEVFEALRKESLWGEEAINYLWKLHQST